MLEVTQFREWLLPVLCSCRLCWWWF